MKNVLAVFWSKRFKSFYWRLGMMLVATFVNFVSANLTDFQLSPEATVVVGLILGEVSKSLNNLYSK